VLPYEPYLKLEPPLLALAVDNYLGLTGSNVLVNVNNSGVDANHPDLQGRAVLDVPAGGVGTNLIMPKIVMQPGLTGRPAPASSARNGWISGFVLAYCLVS